MEKANCKEICQTVKAYFKYKNISINDVAAKLDSTPDAVSAQLAGRPFSRKGAAKYAELWGFDADYLVTGKGSLFPADPPDPTEGSDVSALIAIVKSQQDTIAALVDKLA